MVRGDSPAVVWADVLEPTPDDGQVLREAFGIHELAVADALETTQHPKVESFGEVLYVVLHGINFQASEHAFDTHDTDFFLTARFLVTVHDGKRRSIAHVAALCARSDRILAEGPVGADAPHRRHDGRPLPARGRRARGMARRSRAPGARDGRAPN